MITFCLTVSLLRFVLVIESRNSASVSGKSPNDFRGADLGAWLALSFAVLHREGDVWPVG